MDGIVSRGRGLDTFSFDSRKLDSPEPGVAHLQGLRLIPLDLQCVLSSDSSSVECLGSHLFDFPAIGWGCFSSASRPLSGSDVLSVSICLGHCSL